jgi:alpha-tubulin suppressor-like RCC1 family protein
MNKPAVGEVYLCSQDSDGEPILLKNFKGVKITNFCGGYYRAFVLEQDDNKGKIHSLHPPEYDEYDYTFTEKNIEDLAATQHEVQEELNNRYNKNFNRVPEDTQQPAMGASGYSDGVHGGAYEFEPERPPERKELSAVREVEAEHPDHPHQHQYRQDDRSRDNHEESRDGHYQDGHEYHDDREDQGMEGQQEYRVPREDRNEGLAEGEQVETERKPYSQHMADADRAESLQTDTANKIYSAFDGKGTIKEIKSGKNHIMLLNTKGELYSYGYGEYGVMGRGMAVYSPVPLQINNLKNQEVAKIACGYQHCLALTKSGEVYSWGRGFEGQLGLSLFADDQTKSYYRAPTPKLTESEGEEKRQANHEDNIYFPRKSRLEEREGEESSLHNPVLAVKIECCSFPRVLRYFNKLRKDRSLKKDFRKNPNLKTEKEYPELTIGDIECGSHHSLAITKCGTLYGWGDGGCGQLGIGRIPKVWIPTPIPIKECVVQVAAGYAHTICITKEGFAYSFGLNNKCQLGYETPEKNPKQDRPKRIVKDDNGVEMKSIIKIGCGDYNNFALSDTGEVYSWGYGVLGIKEISVISKPKIIKGAIAERKITDIYVNSGNVILFSPVKITSMKPACGPSSGGTIFSIIGVGLCDMAGKQRIRFVYGHNDQFKLEASLKYDESTNSYYSQTPNFEAESIFDPSQWPSRAKVAVTLDGNNWIDSDTPFFIYSSRVKISNINPKFASVEGGLEMCIELLTDAKTMKEFSSVSVGFQATVADTRTDAQKVKAKEDEKNNKKEEVKTFNPIDLPLTSPELDKADWIYFEGTVREKDIIVTVPPLYKLKSTSLYYNVDVSLNGQQFLGAPAFFRYYKINVEKITPDNTIRNGGTKIVITGSGFIDSSQKKIRLSNSRTERLIDVKWDKDEEYYFFYTPPINWLSGSEDELTETEAEEIMKEPVKVSITISGKDWIDIGTYSYYEPRLKQLLPGPVPDKTLTEDAIKEHWPKEEPIVNPFEGLNEKEADKKRVELEKKLKEELADIEYMFRKPGSLLYIEGENFVKKESIIARCAYKQMHWDVPAVFKNAKKIGFVVPLIEGPPEGVHDIFVYLSFNGGQDFGHQGLKFKYFCFNKDTPEAERNKLMDAETKNAKKGGKK